jgi:hypothetical protein
VVRWSIIVPKHNHKIEVIENSEYHSPEPINFNELGIEESFLINNEITDGIQVIDNSKDESNKTDSKFNFKLKL